MPKLRDCENCMSKEHCTEELERLCIDTKIITLTDNSNIKNKRDNIKFIAILFIMLLCMAIILFISSVICLVFTKNIGWLLGCLFALIVIMSLFPVLNVF